MLMRKSPSLPHTSPPAPSWVICSKASAQHQIKWQWLKGHAGHVAQEAVDRAARRVAAAGHADEDALSEAAATVAEGMEEG